LGPFNGPGSVPAPRPESEAVTIDRLVAAVRDALEDDLGAEGDEEFGPDDCRHAADILELFVADLRRDSLEGEVQ
jgi:hypothetical protein